MRMKKEPISAISSGAHLQKAQRAHISHAASSGGSAKPRDARGRPQEPARNGKTANGNKSEDKPSLQAIDADRVLSALIALNKGDFGARLPVGWTGIAGKVADTFNDLAETMALSTADLSRISRVVGQEGRIQERLSVGHVS